MADLDHQTAQPVFLCEGNLLKQTIPARAGMIPRWRRRWL